MPNPWKLFEDLLPGAPLQIGTVDAVQADGLVRVALLDGGRLLVSGAGGDWQAGARVFVRSGRIEGPAPVLPLIEIEI